MSKTIIQNRKKSEAIVQIALAAPGAETITVAGESSDLDNDDYGNNETVTGAVVNQIVFGCGGAATGYWKITRGASVLAILNGTGQINYAGGGMALGQDQATDIVCTLINATEGTLTLELQKISTLAVDQYLVG